MTDIDDVVSGLAGHRGVGALVRSSYARQALRTLLVDSAGMGSCRLNRVKFKPGRKLSAWYDLTTPESHSRTRAVAVTWESRAQISKSGHESDDLTPTLEAEARDRHLLAPFTRLSSSLDAIGMRLKISPLDLAYPQLTRLSDATYVMRMLSNIDVDFGLGTKTSTRQPSVLVKTIRYRPGQRHVLSYLHKSGQRSQRLYAKLRGEGQNPATAVLVAVGVADILATHGHGFGALKPAADLPHEGVVLFRHVPGIPLTRLLASDARRTGDHLEGAGRLIRVLHDQGSVLESTLPIPKPMQLLTSTLRACQHIDQLLPPVGQAIAELLLRAGDLIDRFGTQESTFCHGDFKTDHLLVAANSATLIDFDSCVWADPALDLGKFLADLRYWIQGPNEFGNLGDPHLNGAQERFLGGYRIEEGSPLLTRARAYEAVWLVKLAARRVRVDHADWPTRTTALVASAAGLLLTLPRE